MHIAHDKGSSLKYCQLCATTTVKARTRELYRVFPNQMLITPPMAQLQVPLRCDLSRKKIRKTFYVSFWLTCELTLTTALSVFSFALQRLFPRRSSRNSPTRDQHLVWKHPMDRTTYLNIATFHTFHICVLVFACEKQIYCEIVFILYGNQLN